VVGEGGPKGGGHWELAAIGLCAGVGVGRWRGRLLLVRLGCGWCAYGGKGVWQRLPGAPNTLNVHIAFSFDDGCLPLPRKVNARRPPRLQPLCMRCDSPPFLPRVADPSDTPGTASRRSPIEGRPEAGNSETLAMAKQLTSTDMTRLVNRRTTNITCYHGGVSPPGWARSRACRSHYIPRGGKASRGTAPQANSFCSLSRAGSTSAAAFLFP
jgi:hypothetical protein